MSRKYSIAACTALKNAMQPLMTDMMKVGSRNDSSLIVPLVMICVITHSIATLSSVCHSEPS